MARKKVLWLTSWYPNKNDPFDGDFIQRHARAAAIYDDIYVIFVTQANTLQPSEEEFNYATGLTEQFVYYKNEKTILGWLTKQRMYFSCFKKAIENYIIKEGRPAIVHVHIPWKAGLLALWLKKKFRIPYLVTEHWGIYNTTVKDNFQTKSFASRTLLKIIFRQAALFISVSRFLGDSVTRMVIKKEYTVMPNVVDTTLFHPVEKISSIEHFTFIHVSNGAELKNIKGIIDAFAALISESTLQHIRLVIVGTKNPEHKKRAQNTGLLNNAIFFKGEVSYNGVAAEMKVAQVLVLFSQMENSPCVIGEALCCGLPVIASNVGGIPELVDETNSILVTAGVTTNLAKAMQKMINEYSNYSKKEISAAAQKKFSYTTISQQFHQIYSSINGTG